MIPEVGRVPGVGLQERVMSIRRRRTHSVAGLEHGWVATELGQFKEKHKDQRWALLSS